MKYLLPCECGEKASIEIGQAGQTIDCPHCAKPLEVPTMREIRMLELDEEAVAAAPKGHVWSWSQGIRFAAGIGVTLIGLTVAGVVYWVVSNMLTQQPDFQIPPSDEVIDKWTAVDAFEFWQMDIERHPDLPPWKAPPHVHQQRYAAVFMTIVFIAIAVAAIGAVIALSSFFVKSKPKPKRRPTSGK